MNEGGIHNKNNTYIISDEKLIVLEYAIHYQKISLKEID